LFFLDFSELSITEVATTLASVTSSNDVVSPTSVVFSQASTTAPKILSYAQMAQKPNGNNKDNINIEIGPEAKDISDASLEPKKVEAKTTVGQTGNQNSGKTPQRKPSGGKNSPRSQRRRPSEKTDNGELVPSSATSTSPVLKETYASKFGSSSSDSNKQTTTNISRTKSAANANNTNAAAAKGSANSNKINLPTPRPLMSQVINPPVSKLDEVNGLQLQQQPISFSDTVKKTNTTSSSYEPCLTPTSPKSVDFPAVDSVSTSATNSVADTIEGDKEKLS